MSSTEATPAGGEIATDVNPGADTSSTTAESGVETSLLGAVKAALEGPEASPSSDSGKETSPDTAEKSDGPPAGEGEEPDLTEEEMKRLSSRTQSLIRNLKVRDKEAQTLRSEVETLRPGAERLGTILSYMEKHGIEPTEFDNTLEITRLIKSGDFSKAFEVLDPIHKELAKRAGKVLPDDLREQVRNGFITEAHARELHENRTKVATTEERSRQDAQRREQTRENDARQAVINTAADTMTQWERAKEKSDPDWKQKQPLVAEAVELEVRRLGEAGYPRTKEAVVAIGDKALKTVEERLKRFNPKPTERRTPTSQPVSSRTEARPTSLLDAVKQSFAQT